jgi:AcrR family transcriptional regulator
MLSQRTNRIAANAIPEQQILDAAYDLLLSVGMSRTTMADIARRAGVSRATLYRRWPNVEAVVAALTTREFGALLPQLPDRPGRAEVVTGVVTAVRTLRKHPLTRTIVELDPQFLLPYLLQRRGSSTTAQLAVLEDVLARARGVRQGNRTALARTVWLTAASFVLTAPVLADRKASLTALDAELAVLLDRYLKP